MDLKREFEQRRPWVTKFAIEGVEYGGNFDALNDARIAKFIRSFPDAKTVLELGSLEGGHSFALASQPGIEKVVAIEARSSNIEKAKFVQGLLGDGKVEFVEGDLEKFDLGSLGSFDAVFCSGLLYHLMEPWALIERISALTPNIFIWTQYACEKEAKKFSHGYRGKWYREAGWLDPLSGVSKYSFWLSMGSLVDLLTKNGFANVNILENDLGHPHGCAVTLSATKAA